ncbi:MAG: GTP-binding protein, partial [Agathobacter sp.]|nr:GTP-binding protein [Agathobacter sp.]
MATLNETPKSNRLHIGIFGKTNSGKSSFINAFTGQEVSIVADVKGTTTDPVYKPMEINPLGPCVIIDTAGFDDDSELGRKRVEKTQLAAQKTDIAVILFSASEEVKSFDEDVISRLYPDEWKWINYFKEKNTPLLLVVNKIDENADNAACLENELKKLGAAKSVIVKVSCATGAGIDQIKPALARLLPEDFDAVYIT